MPTVYWGGLSGSSISPKVSAPLMQALTQAGVDSGVFPLFEVEDGVNYILNDDTKNQPVDGYLKQQKRYRHLAAEEVVNIQSDVDLEWERLQQRVAVTAPVS